MEIIFDTNTVISLATLFGIALIKFNDLKHMERDLQDIKEEIKSQRKNITKIDKKQVSLDERIKTLEKE